MKVRVLSPALEEISAAILWFESKRAGLGHAFRRSTDAMLRRIEADPHFFGKSDFAMEASDIRYAVIRRFNYVIYFLVEQEEIQIVSVAHGSREPGYWSGRTSPK